MQFIKGKTGIDIGDTPVENIFLDAFMPSAEGSFVKVYLLGYKYACNIDSSKDFTNDTIARALDIPVSTVLKAWDYWERQGIIKKHCTAVGEPGFSVEFLSLKHLYINNHHFTSDKAPAESGRTYSPSDLIQAMTDERIRDMFNHIQKIMCRPLNPNESLQCLEWLYDFKMAPEIIEEAFRYSTEKRGVKNIRYINTIISNWYDNNINTLKKLEEHLETTDAKYSGYNRIMKALGRAGNPTRIEKQYMDKWLNEYKMPLNIILKACDRAVIQIPNPSLNYVDGIVKSWHDSGFKTLSDIAKKDKETRPQKQKSPKSRFHNFEQSALKLTNEQLKEILNKHKDA